VLGADANTGVPKPGNDEVAPPNKGLGGATSSLFSDGCSDGEGVRLKGSEVVVVDCVDGVNVCRVGGVGPKLNGARTGPWVSEVCAGVIGV
jgi:hypothetical protein